MNTGQGKKEEITIKKEEGGARLDKFLAQKFPDFSRSYLQKLIRKGKVLINGKKEEARYKIRENDKIVLESVLPEEISLLPDGKLFEKIKVIYEDDDVIVVDKPAGLVVHPSATHKSGTLVNALLSHWPALTGVGEDKLRPGIVHRLDKDTSGLIVAAKNNSSFQYLKKLFRDRNIEKHYISLVAGEMKDNQGVIDLPIARSQTIPVKQVALKGGSGEAKTKARPAVTRYKVLKAYTGWTLVEAYPKTGRMHQIRVHFRAIGHPVANDRKYAFRHQQFIKGLERHFLHAAYIKFKSSEGKVLEFSVPLPVDLQKALDTISEEKPLRIGALNSTPKCN